MASALFRQIRTRGRLFLCVLLGVVLFFCLPFGDDYAARWLLSWNIAVLVYLAIAGTVMSRATGESMQKRAQEVDEGRYTYLIMSMTAACASLAAIFIELTRLKGNPDHPHAVFYVLVSLSTIVLSWAFIQIVFTEHYAHEYYMKGSGEGRTANREGGGIKFLGTQQPNYIDFLYFTVTIGVASQTADIGVPSRQMRLLVLIHSIISFFFNTTILALSINIAASFL